MSHELGLSSAYPSVTPYTNCTHEFRGVLDYIFCQRDAFRVASVLAVLPLEQLPFPALPNGQKTQNKLVFFCFIFLFQTAHFPSDHVALFASVFLR
jgi:mRNA deadenylase 3'-5' endonuclease subunit Ccr4